MYIYVYTFRSMLVDGFDKGKLESRPTVTRLGFAKNYVKDRTRIKQPKLNDLVTVGCDSSFASTPALFQEAFRAGSGSSCECVRT